MFCAVEYPFGQFESHVQVALPKSFFESLLTDRAWDTKNLLDLG